MKTRLPLKVAVASLLTVIVAVILWACQKEKYPDENIDAEIARSAEMENYIVAGYELQAALNEWQNVLNAIDFSKLEFVPDADGKLVMHVPVQSLVFDAKLRALNTSRSVLQSRYPELASFVSARRQDIIESCISNSVVVNTKLLDMGINIFQPMTRRIRPELFDDSMLFLNEWTTNNHHYVEAVIVVYRDGSSSIYIDPRNTYKESHYPGIRPGSDGLFYYPEGGSNSAILFVGHTHLSDGDPSATDRATAVDGLREAVYYNGNFYAYDKNGRI